MDLNAYQKQAMRTSPEDHDRVKNGCLGLIGESGEIVDIIKKWMFQSVEGTPLPVDKLIDEMGDVLWYCAELATGSNLRLGETIGTPGNRICSLTFVGAAVMLAFDAAQCALNALNGGKNSAAFHITKIYEKLLCICGDIGTTIEHVAEHNIEKLKKRYPDGFDPERSMNRPEYAAKKNAEQTESASGLLFETRNRPV